MTDRLDPALAALERRLDRASPPAAPTGLRRRVLTAVDDVLHEKATPSIAGRDRGPFAHNLPDGMALGVLASALAVVVVVVTLLAGSRSATPALRASRGAEIPVQSKTLRVLDGHRLLQETL